MRDDQDLLAVEVDSIRTRPYVSDVLFGVGVASLAVAGGWALLTWRNQNRSTSLEPKPQLGGAALLFSGTCTGGSTTRGPVGRQ